MQQQSVHIFDDPVKALGFAVSYGQEIMVIGGSEIYQQFLEYANRLYVTIVDIDIKGDRYFPAVNRDQWFITELHRSERDAFLPSIIFEQWDRQ